ncbi:MAG: VOC family protein [Haloechinothrix sp.]
MAVSVQISGHVEELARAWFAAHDANDTAALAEVLHPEVEVHSLFRPEPAQGRDSAIAHFAGTMGAFPDLKLEIVAAAACEAAATYLAEVDFVGHFSGTWTRTGRVVAGTGRPFRVRGAALLGIRDARIRVVRTLFDRDDWLVQIGLSAARLEEQPTTTQETDMTKINYAGLNHLALVTNDMDKTVRFYRDVLGMPLVGTTGNRDENYPHRHYFLSLGRGASIAFFEWKGIELPPRKDSGIPASGIQFDHVSVSVESDDDLAELGKRLVAAGYDASDVVDHGLVRSLYCTDPNGISIEFSVPVVDLDAEPYFDDADPVPAARETQPQAG